MRDETEGEIKPILKKTNKMKYKGLFEAVDVVVFEICKTRDAKHAKFLGLTYKTKLQKQNWNFL